MYDRQEFVIQVIKVVLFLIESFVLIHTEKIYLLTALTNSSKLVHVELEESGYYSQISDSITPGRYNTTPDSVPQCYSPIESNLCITPMENSKTITHTDHGY